MKVLREVLNVPTWVDADEWEGAQMSDDPLADRVVELALSGRNAEAQRLMFMEKVMAGEKASERYCVDCSNLATDGSWLCKRQTISLVTGLPWTLDLACHTERQPGGGCGTEGKFWKERVVTMTNAAGEKLEVPAEMFEPDRPDLEWTVSNRSSEPCFIKVYNLNQKDSPIWQALVPGNGGVVLGWTPFGETPVIVKVSDRIEDESVA